MNPISTAADAVRSLQEYTSGGKKIRIETFTPPQTENAPSVIVLHGATGVEFANRFIVVLGQGLASQGLVVHLVHYFDRTGTTYASDEVIKRSSAHWLETIQDAVDHVRRQRPQASIGLFGYSLGGYLAAAEGVRNADVKAAVILAGGVDEGSARSAKHAPPMLILHGDRDTRVPVSEARRLESTLRQLGGRPELHLYPGEGHIMSMPAYADVLERGVRFLQEQLHAVPTSG